MSELRFDGQVVVVTGAGRGIGRCYALLLAERGASVVVNDAGVLENGGGGSVAPAQAVVAEIEARGGRAVASAASVAYDEGAREIVRTALDHFGRLDAVINNAGIFAPHAVEQFDSELFRSHLEVHVLGSALIAREAWPHLAKSGGRLVNTTSAGLFGMPAATAYVAAKGGVFGLTRALAVDGREVGIRVNCIAPAAVTRLMRLALADTPDESMAQLEQAMAPDAIAPVAAYLAHGECAVSGECLVVSGGRVSRYILAETPGIYRPEMTPELVRDELAAIMDPAGYAIWPDTQTASARLPG